jgi:hypothetical protein
MKQISFDAIFSPSEFHHLLKVKTGNFSVKSQISYNPKNPFILTAIHHHHKAVHSVIPKKMKGIGRRLHPILLHRYVTRVFIQMQFGMWNIFFELAGVR